ncbi:MAG: DegV family protein [Clostridiales bacterium]|nr:DegV family protein [Clostridiales bacterium]
MSKIIVSVEATADITLEIQARYSIAVAPMEFIIDGKSYSTVHGVDAQDFYASMRNGAVTKTSLVNEAAAREHLEGLLLGGAEVLHFCISSKLSGTYASFVSAAAELDRTYPGKVRIVDARTASCGILLMAVACCIKAEQGATLNELFDYAQKLRDNTSSLFTVDSLTYLARTGRISKGAAIFGNAIQLKVAMRVTESGELVPYKKMLSRRRALAELITRTKAMYVPDFDQILLAHADCEADAKHVAGEVESLLGIKVQILPLGPVIGCHSGPGTLALFFTSDGKEIKG